MATLQPDPDVERRAVNKSLRYLVPLLIVGFTVMNLDRTNIGIAALTMNKELGITPQQFGLISGIFFAGYLLFEVPSNLILHRVGARLWIARIMFTWGLVTVFAAFANGATAMFWCRVLLGIFEAGFLPGMLLYLTFWFTKEHRSRMLGWFFLGVPLGTVIGAPLGGFLVGIDQMLGLTGWRWLFLIEGVATLVLAVVYFLWLPNTPAQARWLTEPEKEALTARLDAERGTLAERSHGITALTVFRQPRVLGLSAVLFGLVLALYGVGLWLPQLIRTSLHISGVMPVALLTAVPYLLATPVGQASRPARQPGPAHRHPDAHRGAGAGRVRAARRGAVDRLCGPLPEHPGRAGVGSGVLLAAVHLPHRDSRGHRLRLHQLRRQHRRFRRAVPGRLGDRHAG
jgi:ACS family tartrate transporter-like MFS transporter